MPKKTDQVTDGETNANTAAVSEVSSDPSHGLDLHDNAIAIAEAIEAARAMAISFVEYTKPEVLFDMSEQGAQFTILDCVTININDGKGGRKPVQVFRLIQAGTNGDADAEYFVMLSVNPVRDRIAEGFFKTRIAGISMQAGPVRLVKTPTKNPNPAWTFATQKGFRITQR